MRSRSTRRNTRTTKRKWTRAAFAGGPRIVDIADPQAPQEVGYFIPEPAPGKAAPQTNDVEVDSRGLVYIVDRYAGFDVLEFSR